MHHSCRHATCSGTPTATTSLPLPEPPMYTHQFILIQNFHHHGAGSGNHTKAAALNDPRWYGIADGMQRIKAPQAWDIYAGQGGAEITVCVIESMDVTHEDLQGNMHPKLSYDPITGNVGMAITGGDEYGTCLAVLQASRVCSCRQRFTVRYRPVMRKCAWGLVEVSHGPHGWCAMQSLLSLNISMTEDSDSMDMASFPRESDMNV
eukprot:365909-Chlamydomonas_euryale.AAC.3